MNISGIFKSLSKGTEEYKVLDILIFISFVLFLSLYVFSASFSFFLLLLFIVLIGYKLSDGQKISLIWSSFYISLLTGALVIASLPDLIPYNLIFGIISTTGLYYLIYFTQKTYVKDNIYFKELFLLTIVVLGALILLLTNLGVLESLQIIVGVIFFLFLPGMLISYLIYPKKDLSNWLRIPLGFGLSILITPLLYLYAGILGIQASNITYVVLTGLIIFLASFFLFIKRERV